MVVTGVVRHITVNDINVGRNVDEILRLIKAHQFVEVSAAKCAVRLSCTSHTVSMLDNCALPTAAK